MFSLSEHYPISKNQFSAGSILHPSDHFSFYYGYILSAFSCVLWKWPKKKKQPENVHILYSVPFWFLTCTSCTVFFLTSVTHSVGGLRGVPGDPNKHPRRGSTMPRWWRARVHFRLCLFALSCYGTTPPAPMVCDRVRASFRVAAYTRLCSGLIPLFQGKKLTLDVDKKSPSLFWRGGGGVGGAVQQGDERQLELKAICFVCLFFSQLGFFCSCSEISSPKAPQDTPELRCKYRVWSKLQNGMLSSSHRCFYRFCQFLKRGGG